MYSSENLLNSISPGARITQNVDLVNLDLDAGGMQGQRFISAAILSKVFLQSSGDNCRFLQKSSEGSIDLEPDFATLTSLSFCAHAKLNK